MRDSIDSVLESASGRGRGAHDALLLFSGGKDSTYLLHRVATRFPKLRLLTVLVDNGFMSPVALSNAVRVLQHFDVGHVTLRLPPAFVRKVFRHALLNLDGQVGYSIVDLLDGYMTFDAAKLFAARRDIPLILCGLSRVQAETAFGSVGYELSPEQERAPLVTHAGIVLRDVFTPDEMQHWFDGSLFPKDRVPRFLLPNCAWNVGETEIVDEVSRLGLLDRKQSSPLLTNNALIPVIGMAEVAKFGHSCFEVEFARMVREGKSERGYWLNVFEMLEYATRTGRFIGKSVTHTLARLGLTLRDLDIGASSTGSEERPATLVEMVERRATRAGGAVAFYRETKDGWEPRTNSELWDDVRAVATALRDRGVRKGDRIGVLARPSYEWEVADKAIMYLGAITVGLDHKMASEDLVYVMNDANVAGLFVESEELLARIDADRLAECGWVVLFESVEAESYHPLLREMLGPLDTAPLPPQVEPEDHAAIIFTSGTTGRPKGIPMRHRQLTFGLPIMRAMFADELEQPHRTLAWVPLSNGTGRALGSTCFHLGVVQYFVKDPLTLPEKIARVAPTFMLVVPRLLEKAHAEVQRRLGRQPWLVRWLTSALLSVRATLPSSPVLGLTDALGISRLRRTLWGPDLKFLLCGSAPVDPEILRFFDAVGTPTYEVYGLSEVGVLVSMNRPGKQRYGSVGAALPDVEVRLAHDAEILVRTSAVFEHYWGEERGPHFTDDGFLRTGDLGRLDDGSLYITGRKKELIKTSTGHRVSPAEVERNYRDILGLEQFVVVGNGRKHLSALVVVGDELRSRLAVSTDLSAYVHDEMEKRHARLAGWQQVKRFALLPRPLSVEAGELTPTLKVKRNEIEHQYRDVIDSLYREDAR